ncbi:hypothetical protein GJ744_009051 [Endocarpon pusillum]|uniref:Uncharacterized protein n=1 Tax=Endocarpon pusillum TaxID=364733 RepID=A0A8H7E309_9EURO|nr:hypothetical protein GJ744_009051 [Endocarpon pusillum]
MRRSWTSIAESEAEFDRQIKALHKMIDDRREDSSRTPCLDLKNGWNKGDRGPVRRYLT